MTALVAGGDPPRWQALLAQATVAISAGEATVGTGFLVAPGIVATCVHVLAGAHEATGQAVASGRTLRLHVTAERLHTGADGLDLALAHADGAHDLPCVLLREDSAIGDPMWGLGHPQGMFRGGQHARFTYLGPARRAADSTRTLMRVEGTPVGGGYSGSPIVNLRTGAVCGMLCSSNKAGSAHLIGADTILEHTPEAREQLSLPHHHREWLDSLTDEQLRAGGWPHPGPRLRRYLDTARRAAQRHPYPGLLPGVTPPPLSTVYVRQSAQPETGANRVSALSVLRQPGDTVIVGEAGAGKSSLLRQAVVEFDPGAAEAEPFVPVRVVAADLVAPRPLPESIAASVNADLSAVGVREAWPPDFFARPPLPGARWLVLVDGLDEIVDGRQRSGVADRIDGLRGDIYRFVLATRPVPDERPWPGACFELLPFDDSDLPDFALRWLSRLGVPDPATAADAFLNLLPAGLSDLARNPLMATMLCQLYATDRDRSLPTSRAQLYQLFTDVVYSRQYSGGSGGAVQQIRAVLGPHGRAAEAAGDELIDRAFELIADLATARQRGDGRPAMRILAPQLDALRPRNVTGPLWRSLCRDLLRRSGLLVERDNDFVFLHQTIAEYLAAKHATLDGLPEMVATQGSYARFVVAAWEGREALSPVLRRIAERDDDLSGPRFIADLSADGVALEPAVCATAAARLARTAADRDAGAAQRRTCGAALTQLDPVGGRRTLEAIVRDRTEDGGLRVWALGALAEAQGRVPSADPAFDGARRYQAMRRLGASTEPQTQTLLADIACDTTFEVNERLWAAEALHERRHPRACEALHAIAVDTSLHASRRQRAAKRLGDHPSADFRALREQLSSWEVLAADLVAAHIRWHPEAVVAPVQRAYEVARRWHEGQMRRSGDDYIMHPLAVAVIVAELGMDTPTLIAALLHDTIEDTEYTLDQMRAEFGDEVAALVDGLNELDRWARTGTSRAIVASVAKEPRVVVLKLADRLHNVRTLDYMPPGAREHRARETLEVMAPIAYRIGMESIGQELEDASFRHLYPKRYRQVRALVGEEHERAERLRTLTSTLERDLARAGIQARVTGRNKHLYAIYQELVVRGRALHEIDDLTELHVSVGSPGECQAAAEVAAGIPARVTVSAHTSTEREPHARPGRAERIDTSTWMRALLEWQRESGAPGEPPPG